MGRGGWIGTRYCCQTSRTVPVQYPRPLAQALSVPMQTIAISEARSHARACVVPADFKHPWFMQTTTELVDHALLQRPRRELNNTRALKSDNRKIRAGGSNLITGINAWLAKRWI